MKNNKETATAKKTACSSTTNNAVKAKKSSGKKRITFTLQAEAGKIVSIAGSFNDWDPTVKYLTDKNNEGIYKAVLLLEPGVYEYKFVIDGIWHLDEANANFSSNDFGSLNSVVDVK